MNKVHDIDKDNISIMKARFKEEGFFVVRNLLTLEEVEQVKKQLTELVKLWPDRLPEDIKPMVDLDPKLTNGQTKFSSLEETELKVRRFFRMSVHDEYFRNLALHPNMVNICNATIGEDVKLLQSMAICKPPGSAIKRWHQDNAYFQLSPNDVMAFWIAIDPAEVENGCMHVVPKSHKEGISPHGIPTDIELPKGQEHSFYGLLDIPSKENWVAIECQPGDALVFHGEMKHFTPPNMTNSRRRALQFHYASSHCVPTTPQFWYYRKGEMLVSGKEFGGNCI